MAVVTTMDSDGRDATGGRYVRRGTVTLGTYASGGVAVTPATFELNILHDLRVDNAGGYVARYDKTNKKVMLYIGKDPGNAGGADVVLQEVGAVDVSATSFRFRAEGR